MIYYVGIDNGVTGAIGIISSDSSEEYFFPTPTIRTLNYQKSKVAYINRVNVRTLKGLIHEAIGDSPAKVLLERPFVNSKFFSSSISAVRALEATLIVLEALNLGYDYIDSKIWQKHFLPKGKKGTELKTLSKELGSRKWPQFAEAIEKQKDADGMFIAEYCKVYHTEKQEEPQENLDV